MFSSYPQTFPSSSLRVLLSPLSKCCALQGFVLTLKYLSHSILSLAELKLLFSPVWLHTGTVCISNGLLIISTWLSHTYLKVSVCNIELTHHLLPQIYFFGISRHLHPVAQRRNPGGFLDSLFSLNFVCYHQVFFIRLLKYFFSPYTFAIPPL